MPTVRLLRASLHDSILGTNIGVAIPSFQPDHAVQGHILSAFYYGYIATQILGAHVAAWYGPKIVLLVGVITWTFFDVLTVPFAENSTLLWIARVGMGLGEGIIFPCMHSIALAWYPLSERSRLTANVSSGMDLGTVVAMLLSPWLMTQYGYPAIFITFGVLSSAWIVLFAFRGSDAPDADKYVSSGEKALVLSQRGAPDDDDSTMHFYAPPVLAIYVTHFAYNYGWYVLLGWIPQYLRLQLHLEVATSGVAAALPYFCGYVGVLVWGFLSDDLIGRGVRVVTVRKLMNGLGLIGSGVSLYMLRFVSSSVSAVALLSATLFLSRGATAGYWINMLDVAPRHAGHLMAVSNTVGTIPGIFGNIMTGQILAATGNWDLVFLIASAIMICGGVVFQVWASDVSQEESASPRKGGGGGGGRIDDRTALLATL
ncbi:hypothetical protein DYB31_010142 [Aphanomyces astaci]|uniref:Major facilitator superfamily (MFS) profile domain-containing protein n=3 Tax=Aphanomyces astaci TaxID=112090 RepID=A0A397FL39_APHAT|nr:hypothetical protein DYB31_010142 [Aphanomyces astaci]